MRRTLFVLTAALIASSMGQALAAEHCKTSDSAICISDPNCHWDGKEQGCEPGAPPYQDPCVVHTDQAVCDTDLTLGCKWNSEKKDCEHPK